MIPIALEMPSELEVRAIQESEGAYYWSACTPILFAKHGICRAEASFAGAPKVITRNTAVQLSQPCPRHLLEAPLHRYVASQLGLNGRMLRCEKVTLYDQGGRPIGSVSYGDFTVRKIPMQRGEVSDPHLFVSDDMLWNSRAINAQKFNVSENWQVLATATTDANETFPAVLANGCYCVLAVPLLDLILFSHARPPLNEGYYAPANCEDLRPVEVWLSGLIRSWFGDNQIHVARWPAGFSAAFTVRLDYDRPITDDSLRNMLDLLDEVGVRCSCYFMTKLLDVSHVRNLVDRGHEVGLHSVASNQEDFRRECKVFAEQTGLVPRGYTSHGGTGAGGHLGETQHRWASALGMQYGEMLGFSTDQGYAAIATEDGIPRPRRLALLPSHESLDFGTAPDAHALDALLETIPQRLRRGEHVILMNHPDIHRQQLETMLRAIDMQRAWSPTLAEAAAWAISKAPTAHAGENCIDFANPLSHAAEIRIGDATIPVPAHEQRIELDWSRIARRTNSMTSKLAFFSNSSTTVLSDFGADVRATNPSQGITIFTNNGPIQPSSAEANIYSSMPARTYDLIEVGRSLRLFESPWFAAFLAHLNHALTEDGTLIVPFYPDSEATKKGFWSRGWLQSKLGSPSEELPGDRLRFHRLSNRPLPPSVLSWYFETKEADRWDVDTIEALRDLSPDELQSRFGGLLASGVPVGPIDKAWTLTVAEELARVPYSVGGVGYKTAILRKIINEHCGEGNPISLLDVGGDYGQIACELLLDETCPVTDVEVVDVSPTKLALAAKLRDRLLVGKEDTFHFRLQPAQNVSLHRPFDVISFIGSLLYVPKGEQRPLLERLWKSLKPGGLLIIHENIKALRYTRDYDSMFEEDKLEALLEPFGPKRYFLSSASIEVHADKVGGKTVFRVMEKPRSQGLNLLDKVVGVHR